jgi:hypothetical protein
MASAVWRTSCNDCRFWPRKFSIYKCICSLAGELRILFLMSQMLKSFMLMSPTKILRRFSFFLGIALFCSAALAAADTPSPHDVPSIDGALGPCSIAFTAKDATGAPLYNVKIRVHIATGVLGIKKTDLEAGTNADGKANFTGLPDKTKFPLEFDAQQGDLAATFTYTPAKGCKPQQESITLKKP